ncbi:unnamed protein product [Urochloa humidicola]
MEVEAGGAQHVLPNPVADLVGMPRTRSDFALRIVQAGSAIGAIVAMVSAKDFSSVVPFVFKRDHGSYSLPFTELDGV